MNDLPTSLPAALADELRALGWFALPEDEARQALRWKRRCEDRDERIERLCRAVAALRAENTEAMANAWDEGHRSGDAYAYHGGAYPREPNPYRAAPSGVAPPAEPCIGHDPTCPCQDGDWCHYVDDPVSGTKAMPIPSGVAPADTTEEPADG